MEGIIWGGFFRVVCGMVWEIGWESDDGELWGLVKGEGWGF